MYRFKTLVFLVLISQMAFGQKSKDALAHQLVDEFVSAQEIPGLAAAVYHNGEIVWSKGFGFANVELRVPVDPQTTKFRIGSISKTLTASALGKLMDTMDVNLDAPIQDYVPDFPVKNHNISIRQLGGHTAGIRHYKGGEFMSTMHYPTVAEGLDIFKDDPLLFEPGKKYQYSSYGWNLLSAAIENIAGQPFLKYIDDEVFGALGMHNTVAEYSDQIIPGRTAYYIGGGSSLRNAPFVDNSYKWAGGGFLSTVHDIVLFGKAHTKEGFLSAQTLETLIEPQQLADGSSTNYGIGWRTYKRDDGTEWIGHSGGSVGGTSIYIMSPSQDMIVVITGNKSSIRYGDIHFKLAEIFLKK